MSVGRFLGGISVLSSFDDPGGVTETLLRIIRQRYILSFPRPGNGSAGAHWLEINTNAKGVIVRSFAASAPLLDNTRCTGLDGSWLCPAQRPQYGTEKPPFRRSNRIETLLSAPNRARTFLSPCPRCHDWLFSHALPSGPLNLCRTSKSATPRDRSRDHFQKWTYRYRSASTSASAIHRHFGKY